MMLGALQATTYAPAPAPAAAARDGGTVRAKPAAVPAVLSADDQAVIVKLKQRDTEVRQHEQAHLAAAGGLALSGATYTYQRGPDGINYAVGGEVQIDTSAGNTPEETIARARQVVAAALAPADPSGADRAAAAQALQQLQQAQAAQSSGGGARDRSADVARAYADQSANSQLVNLIA
jgi:hypothetical protein